MYNSSVIDENPELSVAESFTFKGEENKTIHALKWIPSNEKIKALIIINHGMAEHIARYSRFASFLTQKGFAVYGEDHRGHGLTAGSVDECGYFDDKQGWMKVVGDIRALYLQASDEHKGIPVFFFGHSMGSFLTRHYLSLYGSELSGVILSGTGSNPAALLAVAKVIANVESSIKGKKHRSNILDSMSFGSFNKPYLSENPDGFGWLSRDRDEVKKYMDDPYCGFISTCGMFSDLFTGLQIIGNDDCFKVTSPKLPILLYSGKSDPVGGEEGKGVKLVAEAYRKAGVEDLTLILKEDYRHECLNEIDREKVFEDIYEWLVARLKG